MYTQKGTDYYFENKLSINKNHWKLHVSITIDFTIHALMYVYVVYAFEC